MRITVKTRVVVIILFLIPVFFMLRSGLKFDTQMWINWALYIDEHGLGAAYNNPKITYHPIYLYVIYLYTQILGSKELIVDNIHYLKVFTLVFDVLPILIVSGLDRKLIKKRIPYLLLLLNIAYLYNSYIWGQIDSIHTCLVFLALLIGIKRPVPGFLLYLLAFNTKTQAIIFLPLMLLVLIYSTRNLKQLAGMLLAGTIIQYLILLPFISGGSIDEMWYSLTHLVDYYRNVSINAYNMWHIFFRDAYHTMDYETFGPLTYKQIGLILFFISSGLALLPMMFRLMREYKARRVSDDTMQMMFLLAGLLSLFFFYFNTQMHERYSHPMLLFFFFYGVYSKNYNLYALASVSYFLSLEAAFPNFFPMPHPKIIFAMKVITIWYTLTLVYGMWLFFREYGIGKEYRMLKSGSSDI